MEQNRVCELFGIKYPIISGGMVWCSGWRLVTAVGKCGGLGLLGAGSMHPETLLYHIRKCKEARMADGVTPVPYGVNVPLLYPEMETIMQMLADEQVPVVFTSAGSPKKWTPFLKGNGIKVCHVVSSSTFAKKAEDAGVDAVVAEGFEAGGHNGKEETTTLCLIPAVRQAVTLPLIAAGGIALKCQIKAVEALGTEGVQIGTRFALSKESSASEEYKKLCLGIPEGGTKLLLKKLAPARLLANNGFTIAVEKMENEGASAEQLREFLGKGRTKMGIFDGNVEEGEMEIGQIASMIPEIQSVEEIFNDLI